MGLTISLHGGVGGPFTCWGRKGKPGGVLEVPKLHRMCDPLSTRPLPQFAPP